MGDGIGDGPFPPLVMEVGVWERGSGALEPAGGSRNTESMLVLPFLDSSCIEDETFTSWAVEDEVGSKSGEPLPREVELLLACVACRNAAAVTF